MTPRSARSARSRSRSKSQALELPPKEILDRLPDDVRVSVIEAASFRGPLPPPTMFSAYEHVLPGSADRILRMAEREQEHRINWENIALPAGIHDMKRTHWITFIVSMSAIVAAVILGMNDVPIVAGLLGSSGLVGAVLSLARYLFFRSDE